MKNGQNVMCKILICFLCFTFFQSVSGLPGMLSEAKEIGLPIGEIVSRGEVRFEAKEKVWKSIESSHFSIFSKGRIQTGKGTGIVTLANNCQVEMDQYSLLSIDQVDRLNLSQGRVNFRIPSGKEMTIKVGSLTVTNPRVQQASTGTAIVPAKNEDTVGSVTLHSNGSVTIRNLQGSLSILDQDRVVVAALSSKESITIPATMASGKSNKMMAQAGEVRERKRVTQNVIDREWTYLGLNAVEWIAVGYAAILAGGLTYAFWPGGDKDQETEPVPEEIPACP